MLKKLKEAIGQKVFVVFAQYGSRRSDYGKLTAVNDRVNVVLEIPFGDSIIPIDNGVERILKVYDRQGRVIYDTEKKPKKQARPQRKNQNPTRL